MNLTASSAGGGQAPVQAGLHLAVAHQAVLGVIWLVHGAVHVHGEQRVAAAGLHVELVAAHPPVPHPQRQHLQGAGALVGRAGAPASLWQ